MSSFNSRPGGPTDPAIHLRALSFGGGVQSVALGILSGFVQAIKRGEKTIADLRALLGPFLVETITDERLLDILDFPLVLFANVGHDSEDPATLAYIEHHWKPFAAAHHLEFVEVQAKYKGQPTTVYEHTTRPKAPIVIPMRLNSGKPARRICTADHKVTPLCAELKRRGAMKYNRKTRQRGPHAVTAMGISADEYRRIKAHSHPTPERPQWIVYPLFELWLTRADCEQICVRAGLPVPPKSACYFCPYRSKNNWIIMRQQRFVLFERAAQMEMLVNEDRVRAGFDPIWLTDARVPLMEAIPDQQVITADADGAEEREAAGSCESGYCFV